MFQCYYVYEVPDNVDVSYPLQYLRSDEVD